MAKILQKVRVISFHGLKKEKTHKEELGVYWNLIDLSGMVVSPNPRLHPAYPERGSQVLVRFDIQLALIGIDCHNDVSNSLWLFKTDLIET
ncbi:hypothetical protein L4D00_24000 [Photobacterium swingsii]|uniref:hypothetical protein n=1 Tax=Photobacterium swingsii TaxID=680026 RepID=UPI003D0AEC47